MLGGILGPFGRRHTDFVHISFKRPNQVNLGKKISESKHRHFT